MRWIGWIGCLLLAGALASACASAGRGRTTIPTVAHVDLPRFMGDWHVIAHIPTAIEQDAYDAVESYAMRGDGKVQTTYRQRRGGFDAPLDTMRPVATIRPGTGNAVWGMQFVWPVRAEYAIVFLDEGYTQTIIGRSARDYAWIMARTPEISERDYAAHVERLRALDYDIATLRRVPQRPR